MVDKQDENYRFRYDAVIYSQAFGSRAPGTHSLHLIEEADHNFTNVDFSSYRGDLID
jgi:hypothetical protein